MKRLILILCLIALFAAPTFAQVTTKALDAGWQWRLTPFLGGGVTLLDTQQFALQLGIEVGTFPAALPIVGGRPFGGFLCTVGDRLKAGGLGMELGTVAETPIWLGLLAWKADSVKADAALFVQKPFSINVNW